MKMPFNLGARFVLRLVIPSIILAMALWPLAKAVRKFADSNLSNELLLGAIAAAVGFAFLLLDMPIYMLLEGRRYWPPRLRGWGVAREAARLAILVARSQAATDRAIKIEFDLRTREFPIAAKTGIPHAAFPTRLGNLLASFETYPTVKYGLDGVFFWARLWVAIDKDLREELDSAQALVDGAIYASASLAGAASVALVNAIVAPQENKWFWLAAVAGALPLSRLCYLAALPRYVQYGELFAATFDQHRAKLDFSGLLTELDRHIDPSVARTRTPQEAARAVWRFLRWHRYRRIGATDNETVQDF